MFLHVRKKSKNGNEYCNKVSYSEISPTSYIIVPSCPRLCSEFPAKTVITIIAGDDGRSYVILQDIKGIIFVKNELNIILFSSIKQLA